MLIAILLQYYSNNESQLAYKIFKNNSTVKTESNLLDDDNTILSHLLHHLQKIDKLYFLVSESFLDNHTTLKNLTSNSNKLVDLTHPKIKQHFKIEISAKSDTTRYLTLLYEKILGSNKNISSLNIEERIDLLLQIIKTNDPGKLIHTQNNTLPQQISDFLKSLPQNSLLDNDKIQAIELFHQIFYSDNPSILVITGSAGTGKSTLINYLIKYAQFLAKDISYKLMAPTGKAARVIEKKTNIRAYTIHKSIYSFSTSIVEKPNNSNDEETDYDIIEYQKLNSFTEPIHFIIIDEASMLTDFTSIETLKKEQERLSKQNKHIISPCTSFHLHDVIQYFLQSTNKIKLIIVGDHCQLPPISPNNNYNYPPALNISHILSKYEKIKNTPTIIQSIRLTRSYRFASDTIFKFSMFLREKIESALQQPDTFNYSISYNLFEITNEFEKNYTDIKIPIIEKEHDFITAYTQNIIQNIPSILIVFRNNYADNLNIVIRNRIKHINIINKNDICICTANNYLYNIMNGEFFQLSNNITLDNFELQEVPVFKYHLSVLLPFFHTGIELIHRSKTNPINVILVLGIESLYLPSDTGILNNTFDAKLIHYYFSLRYLLKTNFINRQRFRFYRNVMNLIHHFLKNTHPFSEFYNHLNLNYKPPTSINPNEEDINSLVLPILEHAIKTIENNKETKQTHQNTNNTLTKEIILEKINHLIHQYNTSNLTNTHPNPYVANQNNNTPSQPNTPQIHQETNIPSPGHPIIRIINDIAKYSPYKIEKLLKQKFQKILIDNLTIDKYLNALQFKYGYAITCHKAQGSEWNNVYITDINTKDMRWLYTAITRASNNFYLCPYSSPTIPNFPFKCFFRIHNNYTGVIKNIINTFIINENQLHKIIFHYYLIDKNLNGILSPFCNTSEFSVDINNLEPQQISNINPEKQYILLETVNNFFILKPERFKDNEIIKKLLSKEISSISFTNQQTPSKEKNYTLVTHYDYD